MDEKRCFIAIDLPDEIKRNLIEIQRLLQTWPAKVKWVEEENLHLTLKFLGDINDEQIKAVKDQLDMTGRCNQAFTVEIKDLGAFPDVFNPKVIWCGIHDAEGKLQKLRDDIEEKLAKAGFAKEPRKFSPHLTLGRVKEPFAPRGLHDLIKNIKTAPQLFKAREIKLMGSQLTPKGPKYTCIHTIDLQEHSSCVENIN